MAHIQANIMKLCSNLNDFRVAKKYTDVTVRCQDSENFKCHRIILASASDFFDTMFSSKFKEKAEEIISLPKTTAKIFKEILDFIYTGDMIISHENVVSILEASDFFMIPGIRDLCIQFIVTNKMNIRNTLDSYVFAFKTNQPILIDILSKDIAEQLRIFSQASSFLELPFDEFNTVMKQYASLSTRKDGVLMAVVTRWIYHHRENRRQYFNVFLWMFKELNAVRYEIMNFFSRSDQPTSNPPPYHTNHLTCQSDACALTHQQVTNDDPMQDSDVLEGLRESMGNNVVAEESLFVYVKYAEEKLMRVFSVNKNDDCAFVCKIPINRADQWMKIVALGNHHLYSFNYIRRNPTKARTCSQSFYAHNSVDMRFNFSLRSPPIIFDDISMCSLKNNIYVYNQTLSRQRIPITNLSNNVSYFFTDEEVSRGICAYNCEVDSWFPVPAMKEQVEDSCMTVRNDVLYLIGGNLAIDRTPTRTTQAYDYRAGRWQKLHDTKDYFVGADCCTADSRTIYVCGGKMTNGLTLKFDDDGEWIKRDCSLPKSMVYHRLNTYAGKLWVMGGYTEDIPSNDLSLLTRSFSELSWTTYSSLSTVSAQETNHVTNNGAILDSVVFEYF